MPGAPRPRSRYVGVFFGARLYADTTLNVLDVVLYGLGWYWWLRGGERHTRLVIGHLTWRLAGLLVLVGVAGSAAMTAFLATVHDAAPLLDATTTVASLIATFIMGRKLLESWHLWILVNLVYITLYVVRHLELTAVLYGLFAVFSVVGLIGWQRLLRERQAEDAERRATGVEGAEGEERA
jgi:nicotinamide mononucleotide transporter